MKANFEAEQIRRNLAIRRDEKMTKLLDRQAAEKAEVDLFVDISFFTMRILI